MNQDQFYECENCNYSTNNKNNYMKHLETRKHSKNYGNSFSPKQYQCPSCNKIYESRSGMWKHSKSCDGISEKTTGILTNTGSNLQNIVIEQSKQITELSDMLGEKELP